MSNPIGLEPLHTLIELDAERIQRHRHQVVLTDGKHHIHQLLGVVALAQRRPRRVTDTRFFV